MKRLPLFLAAGLILSHAWLILAADAPEDPVLKALNDELARSMTLHLEGLDAPYFIQYDVADSTSYHLSAAYGALVRSDQSHSRILVSQLRVGSDALDNSNFAEGGRFGGGRSGLSAGTALPTDNDYLAIRHAIWQATDSQFTEALQTLTRKRAYLKERNLEDRP